MKDPTSDCTPSHTDIEYEIQYVLDELKLAVEGGDASAISKAAAAVLKVAEKIFEDCPSDCKSSTEQHEIVDRFNKLMVGVAEAFNAPPSPIVKPSAGNGVANLAIIGGFETLNAFLRGVLLKKKEGSDKLQSSVWDLVLKLFGPKLYEAFIINCHSPQNFTYQHGAGGIHSYDPKYNKELEGAYLSLDQDLRDFGLKLVAKLVRVVVPFSYESRDYFNSIVKKCKDDNQKQLMKERLTSAKVAHPSHLNSKFAKKDKFEEWDVMTSSVSGSPTTAAVDYFCDNGNAGRLATMKRNQLEALRSHFADRKSNSDHSGYKEGDTVKNSTGNPNGKARNEVLIQEGLDPRFRQPTARVGKRVLPKTANNEGREAFMSENGEDSRLRMSTPCVGEGVSPKTANDKKRKGFMSENGEDSRLRKSRARFGDMTLTGKVQRYKAQKPKAANSAVGRSLKVILTMTCEGKTFTKEYTPSIIKKRGSCQIGLPKDRYGAGVVGFPEKNMNVPRKTIELAKNETIVLTIKVVVGVKPEYARMEIKFV